MAINAPVPNRISLLFPVDDLQLVLGALDTLEAKLNPQLVDLGPDERRTLAKLGPRNVDFVARAMTHLREMPQYKPGFLDVDEFQRDLDAIDLLASLHIKLGKVFDLVDDSLLLAGNEAYKAALACYDALKSAAKMGSLDAKVAVEDLAGRLPQRGPVQAVTKPGPQARPEPPQPPAA
jgi:hypothetical protein